MRRRPERSDRQEACNPESFSCHPERSEGSPQEIPRRPSLRSGHLGMTMKTVIPSDSEGSPHGMPHYVRHDIPTCHPEGYARGVSP
jgi:hypothetical protein